MTTYTWRHATEKDIGRLARFHDGNPSRVAYGILTCVYYMGDYGRNDKKPSYRVCEVQDVDSKDE